MRLRCFLREIRGDRPLRDMEAECGISRATLSRIERGQLLPADKDVPALEQCYGAGASSWYPPEVLLLIQDDHAPDDEGPAS